MERIPAPMSAPKMARAPSVPPVTCAIATIGPTAANVTPIITGSLTPKYRVTPNDWTIVTRPQQKRSAEIRERYLLGRQAEGPPDDQRDGDGPAVHDQHVLQFQRDESDRSESIVYRMRGDHLLL